MTDPPAVSGSAGSGGRLRYQAPFFTVALVVLLLVGGLLAGTTLSAFNRSIQRFDEVRTARFELAALLMLVKDAQRAERGYLLTGDERYLTPYHEASGLLEGQLRTLRDASASLPLLRQEVAGIEQEVEALMTDIARLIRVREEAGFEAAAEALRLDVTKAHMDGLTTRIRTLEGRLDQLLERDVARASARGQRALWMIALLIGVALLTLLLLARRTAREMHQRRQMQEALEAGRAELEARVAARTAELDMQQRRLHAVLHALPASVGVADTSAEITMANPALLRLWNMADATPEQRAEPERYRAWRPGAVAQMPQEQWPLVRALQTGHTVAPEEIEIETFDGTRKTILNSASPIFGESGEVIGGVTVSVDITVRKEEERLLRAREAEARRDLVDLQTLYRTAPIGLAFLDTDLRHVRINDALAGWNGFTVEEHVGLTIDEVLPPALAATLVPLYRRVLETGEPVVNLEIQSETRGLPGEQRHWLVNYHRVTDVHGDVLGLSAVVQDVTGLAEAEEALRESEARFRHMADSAPAMIWVTDPTGFCAFLSRAWYDFTGQSPEQSLGFGWLDAVHPDDRESAQDIFEAAGPHGGAFRLEYRLRRADGAYEWVADTASPRFGEGNAFLGYVGSVVNIADHKQAEDVLRRAKEEAEEANRMKSVFLANMSHEIRTPLTTIIGYAEVLRDELEGESQEFAETIVRGGHRLMETLSSVLTLARLEAGGMEMELRAIHVAAEVRQVVELYRNEAESRALTLHARVEAAAEQAWARLDRGGLAGVLQNLIGNAIKFTPEGSISVTVSMGVPSADAPDGARVCIAVADTGIGMTSEFLPHLFTPFRQESGGMARAYEGSGLGLSISRQLVERMHGTIEVQSTPGGGSRFTVCFPCCAPPEASAQQAPVAAASIPRRGRLLVVEDHADTRDLLEMLLEPVCDLTVAPDLPAALAAAAHAAEEEARPFDAVLTDINLGKDGSGHDVLAALRRHPAYAATPVAAVTAYALPGDEEQFLQEGFSAYLGKPFTADDLLALVASLLNRTPEA